MSAGCRYRRRHCSFFFYPLVIFIFTLAYLMHALLSSYSHLFGSGSSDNTHDCHGHSTVVTRGVSDLLAICFFSLSLSRENCWPTFPHLPSSSSVLSCRCRRRFFSSLFFYSSGRQIGGLNREKRKKNLYLKKIKKLRRRRRGESSVYIFFFF